MEATLNLLVLRCADLRQSEAFYRALGLRFDRHRHGNGPAHLCADQGGLAFELYAATPDRPADPSTRLGFRVRDLDAALASIRQSGASIHLEPTPSEWGTRAVVADPDGRRVEISALD